jgi:hypothetical protein
MLRRKRYENSFAEVRNLLASKPLKDVSAADVVNILSEYEVSRDVATPHLLTLYETVLKYYVQDHHLSIAERDDLNHLRYVLDLDDESAQQAEVAILRTVFREALRVALDDEHLTDEEKHKLEQMAENFTLAEDVREAIYKEEVSVVIQEAWRQAISDRRLTPDEEARLNRMSENLGANVAHDQESQQVVERFRLLARVDAGELPVIDTAIHLQRGEVCHAAFGCRLHEMRSVTKRYNYSGPMARIRIMKGLSWRFGSIGINRVTSEEMRQLDTGTVYITNKRLLFNGTNKNVAIPFKRVIHFTVYQDGIRIEKDSGRDQLFLGEGDLELVSGILEAALKNAKR